MPRRVLLIALWLLIGAVVNVAIAWGLVMLPIPTSMPLPDEILHGGWWGRSSPSPPSPFTFSLFSSRGGEWWVSHESVESRQSEEVTKQLIVRVGVPMQSMQWWATGSSVADVHGAWKVPSTRSGTSAYLPLVPAIPGFALNTCFYALLAWSLIRAPLALRRWRRRRAGWCIACGYDLKGLVESAPCPECGRAIGSSASRRSRARVAASGATRL